jgi:peptide-methionine (R)-S-oxide reductase
MVDEVMADLGLLPIPQTEEAWKRALTPEQYAVMRQAGTDRPFAGRYDVTWDDGTYRCAGCGNPLFDSRTKYDHGCGWPSFGAALPGAIERLEDRSHGMSRTEVRCARCHSHLGHVFDDGPEAYDGTRFCINSTSLELQKK